MMTVRWTMWVRAILATMTMRAVGMRVEAERWEYGDLSIDVTTKAQLFSTNIAKHRVI